MKLNPIKQRAMKTTQKKVIEYHNQTKGMFNVYAFDMNTKMRESAYCGLNHLQAFEEMVNKSAQGYIVLVLDKEGEDAARKWEMEHGNRRIHYDLCKPYAVKTYVLTNSVRRY